MNTKERLSLLDCKENELRPLTPEEMKLFMSICMRYHSQETLVTPDSDFWIESDPVSRFLKACICMRLEIVGVRVTEPVYMLIVAYGADGPGDMVLWAYALFQLSKRLGRKELNMDDLVNAFPFGIPTEEGKSRVWNSQKIERETSEGKSIFPFTTDNWYDTKEAWSNDLVESA